MRTLLILLFTAVIGYGQDCPSDLNHPNNSSNTITLYGYDAYGVIIDEVDCSIAGHNNINCDIPINSDVSYYSFEDGDFTHCMYDYNGTLIDDVLPVDLSEFSVEHIRGVNIITWETLSEVDNDHFVIEYSENGIDWRDIGNVDGSGTTTHPTTYTFLHEDFGDESYYRLRQIDYDGTYDLSNVVYIKNNVWVVRVVDYLGRDADKNYRGVVINIYNNGTTKLDIKI